MLAATGGIARGQTTDADTLKKNIQDRNSQINQLNKDIQLLDGQIQQKSKEAATLKGTISTLDATKTKLVKQLDVTEQQVGATSLTIEQLGDEIQSSQKEIDLDKSALAIALRNVNRSEDTSLVEAVLGYQNVSDLWNDIETLNSFETSVRQKMAEVATMKDQLTQKQSQHLGKKQQLLGLQNQLQDQKSLVEQNKADKSKLLTSTQNDEAVFQKQLAEKKRLADAFQQEITQYESQLNLIINPSSYPRAGKGILAWPVQKVIITQTFGDTAFARSGAYNGKGHDGVDFGASVGTPILAAQSGVIAGVGNTDIVAGCYSFGKWIMIKGDDGLSTLYGHLSIQKVSEGQRVTTGQIIGYSGNTGYTTGPHLHFGVYATQGVRIVKYENSIHCKNAIIPLADLKAYLDPLQYL